MKSEEAGIGEPDANHGAGPGGQMPQRRDLETRLLEYAVRIIKVVESLPRTLAGRHIANQLIRSATSVGAHYEEAQGAESREDFVHKLQIGLKELRESNYWLRLVIQARILPPERMTEILDESGQLRAMLSKAVATAKGKSRPGGSAVQP